MRLRQEPRLTRCDVPSPLGSTQDMLASKEEVPSKRKETVGSPTVDSNCSIQSNFRLMAQSSSKLKVQTTLQFKKRKQRWTPSVQGSRKCNATPRPSKEDPRSFPSDSTVRMSMLQWCTRLEAVMRHKHIFKADTCHLATDIHHRFLRKLTPGDCTEGKLPTAQDQIYILASLWIAIKLVESQSFVPGSYFMGKVSGAHPELIRRAEMAIAMTLRWNLLDSAAKPG